VLIFVCLSVCLSAPKNSRTDLTDFYEIWY
jgi:hypothetical protein